MSGSKPDDRGDGKRTLLGRRCIEVHHGTLRVDERIASILKLSENQILPEPTRDEEEEPTEPAPRAEVVLTPIIRARPSRKKLIHGLAILAVFVLFGAWEARRQWSRVEASDSPMVDRAATVRRPPPAQPAVSRPRAIVQRDTEGALLKISAAVPGDVLEAYCRATDPAGNLRPLGTSPVPGGGSGTLLGLCEDAFEPNSASAIVIYLDPRTSRWNAGDGKTPLRPRPTL